MCKNRRRRSILEHRIVEWVAQIRGKWIKNDLKLLMDFYVDPNFNITQRVFKPEIDKAFKTH